MRDLLLIIILFFLLPAALIRCQWGVLYWYLISMMNPHRLGYGFIVSFPFGKWVAALSILSFFWSEKRSIPLNMLTCFWLLWVTWMTISTLFALIPDMALWQWSKIIKIMFFSVLAMMVMQKKQDLHALLWVIVGSIMFFAVKGGFFTLLTLGKHHVYGPPGSFIADNNTLALAILMILPLFYYLLNTQEHRILKAFGYIAIFLSIFAVFGSQSRGAFVTLLVLSAFILWRTKFKWQSISVLTISLLCILYFLPNTWFERMQTIMNYEQDLSALGRINAWWFAWRLALDRPLVGGGLEVFNPMFFERYAPNPTDYHDSHSIYFEVLAAHGFIGLFFYMMTLWSAWKLSKRLQKSGDAWIGHLSFAIQCGLVAYMVGGSFLGVAYFDLYYALLSILVILSTQSAIQFDSKKQKKYEYFWRKTIRSPTIHHF
jgi:putative inorganic carbon (HCO3(-)) transporter